MKFFTISPYHDHTKVALFENQNCLWEESQHYEEAELEAFPNLISQEEFRYGKLLELLSSKGLTPGDIQVFVATGGMLRPLEGGTYAINILMLEDLLSCKYGEIPGNLGAPLAHRLATAGNSRYAYVVDPPVVDEMSEVSHMSGLPDMAYRSVFHALNQRAVAYREAESLGKPYKKCSLVVCHLGQEISIGVHFEGHVTDVNDIHAGSGPMSLVQSGNVPPAYLVDLCFSGKYTAAELKRLILQRSGLFGHLEMSDFDEIVKHARSGDRKIYLVFEAFLQSLVKEIAGAAGVLGGEVDSIVLTGRMTENEYFRMQLAERLRWISQVVAYPGENEMRALMEGAVRVLRDIEEVRTYK